MFFQLLKNITVCFSSMLTLCMVTISTPHSALGFSKHGLHVSFYLHALFNFRWRHRYGKTDVVHFDHSVGVFSVGGTEMNQAVKVLHFSLSVVSSPTSTYVFRASSDLQSTCALLKSLRPCHLLCYLNHSSVFSFKCAHTQKSFSSASSFISIFCTTAWNMDSNTLFFIHWSSIVQSTSLVSVGTRLIPPLYT